MRQLRRLFTVWMAVAWCMNFFLIGMSTPTFAEEFWPTGPEINAAAAILIEADSGAVLYEKDIHAQHYPASITKIMTTLLALENSTLDEVVTFSHDSIFNVEGTQVGITEGEELTMEQCLYGVMLGSANEIAYAVAEHVGGTLDNFVEMMNAKAVELGCTETHFSNPHGLPDDTHVTSAHDMSLIAREAYKNETFRAITRTVSYTIPPTNKYAEERIVYNHHGMLKQGTYHYEYCTGGKTGYTNAARSTLVTYAEKDGMTFISVIMRDDVSSDQYTDTAAILDYGFNNFHKVSVTESDLGISLSSDGFFPIENNPLSRDIGTLSLDTPASLVLPNQASLEHVTTNISFAKDTDDGLAQINCSLDSHHVGEISISFTPGKDLKTSDDKTTAETTTDHEDSKFFNKKTFGLVLMISLCLLGLIVIIIYCIRNGVFR